MKRNPKTMAVAAVAALSLALTGCGGGGGGGGTEADEDSKTLTIWHYENDESAMAQAWNRAIEIFEDKHPDVEVKVEKQTFEQIQKNAKIVLTGDDDQATYPFRWASPRFLIEPAAFFGRRFRTMELRLNSVNGPTVAQISIPANATWQTINTPLLHKIEQLQNLVLVLTSDNPIEVDWITFNTNP